ncbi:hypothetical protein C1646_773966 [Rhizophagus diaphanus]|nr:hypothetical protein C1646_773966 [Rhizophagus diaphanus] [Rhizophagus sp. MUCL 43196]
MGLIINHGNEKDLDLAQDPTFTSNIKILTNEAKKSIVALCYIIAGLYNKFVNLFKTEVGLYLVASGAIWEAIDAISNIGYSACAKTVIDQD